jgi:hypothetical protein
MKWGIACTCSEYYAGNLVWNEPNKSGGQALGNKVFKFTVNPR